MPHGKGTSAAGSTPCAAGPNDPIGRLLFNVLAMLYRASGIGPMISVQSLCGWTSCAWGREAICCQVARACFTWEEQVSGQRHTWNGCAWWLRRCSPQQRWAPTRHGPFALRSRHECRTPTLCRRRPSRGRVRLKNLDRPVCASRSASVFVDQATEHLGAPDRWTVAAIGQGEQAGGRRPLSESPVRAVRVVVSLVLRKYPHELSIVKDQH